MGFDDDRALAAQAKKDQSKRDYQPQRMPKRFQKNNRYKCDISSIICFKCNEKGHLEKNYPINKGSSKVNK